MKLHITDKSLTPGTVFQVLDENSPSIEIPNPIQIPSKPQLPTQSKEEIPNKNEKS